LIVLSIAVSIGMEQINIISMASSKRRCFNSRGTAMTSYLTILGFLLVDLPFNVETSGPKIFSAISTSWGVRSQFQIPPTRICIHDEGTYR
jgi:hypothetical protein